MSYQELADLPVTVASLSTDRQERETSSGFTRATTTISLSGAGATGRGEDVTYDIDEHAPDREDDRHYRRWGFESAALDLALRQAGTDLGTRLGRTYEPVEFVVSTRLGSVDDADPPTVDRLHRWLDIDPELRFELDPTPEWGRDLIEALPFDPEWPNVKPSRFGRLESLFDTSTTVNGTGSTCMAAASSNSVSAATTSRPSRRCSIPTPPTTWLPAGTTLRAPRSGLASSPLEPPSDPVGLGGRADQSTR